MSLGLLYISNTAMGLTANLLSMSKSAIAAMVLAIVPLVLITLMYVILFARCYKKCPSDKIMVIYGKVGSNPDGTPRSAVCIHGGARMIWPFVQSYAFLDLTPISIEIDLRRAFLANDNRADIFSRFTVAISIEKEVMQNAAERLLGLSTENIQSLASDIITGQLRLTAAETDLEDTLKSYDEFINTLAQNIEGEIKKIGLRLINLNITDIKVY